MTTWGPALALHALDAEGRRVARDASAELEILVLLEALALPATPDIAAFELRDGDAPPELLPVSIGAGAIMDLLNRRIRRHVKRRGPWPGPDPGMEVILRQAAHLWFLTGEPPTMARVNAALPRPYEDLRAFRRAVSGEPWALFLVRVKTDLTSLSIETLRRVDRQTGPSIGERRLREHLHRCLAWDVAGENDLSAAALVPRRRPVWRPLPGD